MKSPKARRLQAILPGLLTPSEKSVAPLEVDQGIGESHFSPKLSTKPVISEILPEDHILSEENKPKNIIERMQQLENHNRYLESVVQGLQKVSTFDKRVLTPLKMQSNDRNLMEALRISNELISELSKRLQSDL